MEKEPKISLREEAIAALNNEAEWQTADEVLKENILSEITEELIEADIQEMNRRVLSEPQLRFWNEYSDDEKRRDAIKVVAERTLSRESVKAMPLDPAITEFLTRTLGEDKKE